MAVQPVPDYIGALLGYIRTCPYVVSDGALVGTALPTGMPRDAIVVEESGGFPQPGPGLIRPRVRLRFYGGGANFTTRQRTARDLWRHVHAWLVETDAMHCNGWKSGDTSVLSVLPEGGPIPLPEPDTEWFALLHAYVPTIARAA